MNIKPYDRTAAVAYAEKWANARNPAYADFSNMGGDCTNFISQCLVAGGMPMNISNPFGWYYQSHSRRSASFTGVQFLYSFLTGNKRRGPFARECNVAEAEPGDIIQLSFDGTSFSHSLLVVQGGADPLVSTHSYDCFGRRLSSYTYAAARALHIMGAY